LRLHELRKALAGLGKELNIEMELFDASFHPVFEESLSLAGCQVIKSVWETQNKFLLLESSKHYLCEGCSQKCPLISGVFFPINFSEGKVFALIARNREDQNNFLNNQDSYIRTGEALVKILESFPNLKECNVWQPILTQLKSLILAVLSAKSPSWKH